MQEFLKIAGAFAVVMAFYFGFALLVNHLEGRSANTAQIQNTTLLMRALQDYRKAQGSYPVLTAPDSPMIELAMVLAKSQIALRPTFDLLELDKNSRYVSYDGNSYGLLLSFNRADNGEPVTCRIEVDARQTGWWGHPPKCPF
jgi:hypothetical protein